MRERPVIGIVPSYLPDQSALLVRDHYINAITAAGGSPFILPLTLDTPTYETLFPLIDGFILTGGQDISPERYGAATGDLADLADEGRGNFSEPTPTREEVECLILSYAHQFDVPVLGICRGMQMINVFFGGTLYADLADQFAPKGKGAGEGNFARDIGHWQKGDYEKASHFVDVVRASKLGEILGAERVPTNSMHHQGVRDVAPALDAVAYGPDGLVEAVEVRDRTYILGVQWHPEFFAGQKNMGCLFSSLVHEAHRTTERRAATVTATAPTKTTLHAHQHVRSCPACPALPHMLSIAYEEDVEDTGRP